MKLWSRLRGKNCTRRYNKILGNCMNNATLHHNDASCELQAARSGATSLCISVQNRRGRSPWNVPVTNIYELYMNSRFKHSRPTLASQEWTVRRVVAKVEKGKSWRTNVNLCQYISMGNTYVESMDQCPSLQARITSHVSGCGSFSSTNTCPASRLEVENPSRIIADDWIVLDCHIW